MFNQAETTLKSNGGKLKVCKDVYNELTSAYKADILMLKEQGANQYMVAFYKDIYNHKQFFPKNPQGPPL